MNASAARLHAVLLIFSLLLSGCFGFKFPSATSTLNGVLKIDSGFSLVSSSSSSVAPMGSVSAPSRLQAGTSLLRSVHSANSANSSGTNEFIVKVKPHTSELRVREIARQAGMEYLRSSIEDYHVFRSSKSLDEVHAALKRYAEVAGVEENALVYPLALAGPNDPEYAKQWALEKIHVAEAWAALDEIDANILESRRIVVAVIDSGIDFTHPDLDDPNLWVSGWDFTVGGNGAPYGYESGSSKADDHGTMVAGIIGALTNNGKGIAGAAWHSVKLMPVRVFGSGDTHEDVVAKAIEWAVTNGANVINLSLGSKCIRVTGQNGCQKPTDALKTALDKAYTAGVTVVAAAGNHEDPIDSDHPRFVLSPANYDTTIAVGATKPSNERSSFSNYGPDLNLMAPGGTDSGNSIGCYTRNIYGLKVGGTGFGGTGYGCNSGTSFAAPHVSAVVAMMLARGLVSTPDEVMTVLHLTARDLGTSGFDEFTGHGLLDALGAVTAGVPQVFVATKSGGTLYVSGNPVRPTRVGTFQLSGIVEGEWTVSAWVDTDLSGTVNDGDYYAEFPSIGQPFTVMKGKHYQDVNMTLARYSGEELGVVY